MIQLKPIETMVLAALNQGPTHGYGLVTRIDELGASESPVRATDLYRVIYRLKKRGLLEEADDAAEGDDRRKAFAISSAGVKALREAAHSYEILAKAAARSIQ